MVSEAIDRLVGISNISEIGNLTSPQGQAVVRLVEDGDMDTSDEELVQKYSLLTFFFTTNGSGWTNSTGWDGKSNETISVCEWKGITCASRRRRLQEDNLTTVTLEAVEKIDLGM